MSEPSFHFFTLVTKTDQYDEMRSSLAAVGFDDSNTLFTVLDNRPSNAHEPYSAITEAVRTAKAPYVVFCHQDLVFYKGPEALRSVIEEVEARDPSWAVLGNTGYSSDIDVAISLDDCGGSHDIGVFPAKVLTLDENFLVIKRDSGVGCTPGLSGFHLYATDLCLNAYQKGHSAYVVDYRMMHKGTTLDYSGLHRLARGFYRVWHRRIRGAVLVTPSMILAFSSVPFLFKALNRPGVKPKLLSRFRLLRTLDYLLRYGRPGWLPMARFPEGDFRGPRLGKPVRLIDALIRRGRPQWPSGRQYDDLAPVGSDTP